RVASSTPPAATVATTSPVYGSASSYVAPLDASVHDPPMNCRYSWAVITDASSCCGNGRTAPTLRRGVSACQDSVLISGTMWSSLNDGGGAYSQSLERGLAVLSAFRSGRPQLGVSELGRELGLSRSTTHRYVATLAALGYLQQDPATKKYRLGPRVLDLGFSAINSMELREVAAPHLRQLSDETGYTVNMAILDDLDIVYVERCRSSRAGQREIDLNLHVGARLPAYCTSLGKVLLAFLAADEQTVRLEQIDFTRRGPNTLTSRTALVAEL